MARLVFILGAGASAEGGCPTMASFFQQARKLERDNRLEGFEADLERIERVRDILRTANQRIRTYEDNLEWVFNALELARTIGTLGDLKDSEIEECRSSLIRLIAIVLQETQRFEVVRVDSNLYRPSAPSGYGPLANLISELHRQRHTSSVISLNYDVGFEAALFERDTRIDYGFSDYRPEHHFPYFKLHGSLNWLRSSLPGEVDVDEAGLRSFLTTSRTDASQCHRFDLLSALAHPGLLAPTRFSAAPLIVPPTEAKMEGRHSLQSVWRRAAEDLSKAHRIIVIGYSWPVTDQFFGYLCTLASLNRTELRKFTVIDIDANMQAKYHSILGGYAAPRFEFRRESFAHGVASLAADYERQGWLL